MPQDPQDPLAAASHPCPYPYYAALRARSGLHWFGQHKLWALVRAGTVSAALPAGCAKVRPVAQPVPAFLYGSRAGLVFAALARMTDGPAHVACRAHLQPLLPPLDTARVAAAAGRVLGPAAQAWHAHHDAAALDALVQGVPVRMVLDTLGLAPGLHTPLLAATAAWVSGLSPLASPTGQQAAISAIDSLLPALAGCGMHGIAALAAPVALLMQAHEATAGRVGAGLLRLGSDSGLQAAALAGTLPWAAFAAEVLRHDPPIQNTRRYLADDLVLDGQRLLAGDSLLLVLASAAHDMPAQDRPAQFQLQRPARSPLPLGLGTHACPGGAAALAIAICAWRHILQVDGRGAPDKPDGSASSASLAAVVQHTRGVSWRASANARLPIFTAAAAV